MSCTVTDTDESDISIEWLKDGKPVGAQNNRYAHFVILLSNDSESVLQNLYHTEERSLLGYDDHATCDGRRGDVRLQSDDWR